MFKVEKSNSPKGKYVVETGKGEDTQLFYFWNKREADMFAKGETKPFIIAYFEDENRRIMYAQYICRSEVMARDWFGFHSMFRGCSIRNVIVRNYDETLASAYHRANCGAAR